MGYTVSAIIKPLDNNKVRVSLGHDFRTAYTHNIRNDFSNYMINLDGDDHVEFRVNDHLINKNLQSKFDKNGKIIREEFDPENNKIPNKNLHGQAVFQKINAQMEKMQNDIRKDYLQHQGKRLPSNSKLFNEVLIYFGADEEERSLRPEEEKNIDGLTDEEVENIRAVNLNDMNNAAKKFVKTYEQEHGVKVLSLVYHGDEKTPHYHAIISNYDFGNHNSHNYR